jgi:hypothetical protein
MLCMLSSHLVIISLSLLAGGYVISLFSGTTPWDSGHWDASQQRQQASAQPQPFQQLQPTGGAPRRATSVPPPSTASQGSDGQQRVVVLTAPSVSQPLQRENVAGVKRPRVIEGGPEAEVHCEVSSNMLSRNRVPHSSAAVHSLKESKSCAIQSSNFAATAVDCSRVFLDHVHIDPAPAAFQVAVELSVGSGASRAYDTLRAKAAGLMQLPPMRGNQPISYSAGFVAVATSPSKGAHSTGSGGGRSSRRPVGRKVSSKCRIIEAYP